MKFDEYDFYKYMYDTQLKERDSIKNQVDKALTIIGAMLTAIYFIIENIDLIKMISLKTSLFIEVIIFLYSFILLFSIISLFYSLKKEEKYIKYMFIMLLLILSIILAICPKYKIILIPLIPFLITIILNLFCIYKICCFLHIKQGGDRYYDNIDNAIFEDREYFIKHPEHEKEWKKKVTEHVITRLLYCNSHNNKENDKRRTERNEIYKDLKYSFISFVYFLISFAILKIVILKLS